VLDEAEDIVNAIGPEILSEVEQADKRSGFWSRFRRRRG
jgi:hypothetical protein